MSLNWFGARLFDTFTMEDCESDLFIDVTYKFVQWSMTRSACCQQQAKHCLGKTEKWVSETTSVPERPCSSSHLVLTVVLRGGGWCRLGRCMQWSAPQPAQQPVTPAANSSHQFPQGSDSCWLVVGHPSLSPPRHCSLLLAVRWRSEIMPLWWRVTNSPCFCRTFG